MSKMSLAFALAALWLTTSCSDSDIHKPPSNSHDVGENADSTRAQEVDSSEGDPAAREPDGSSQEEPGTTTGDDDKPVPETPEPGPKPAPQPQTSLIERIKFRNCMTSSVVWNSMAPFGEVESFERYKAQINGLPCQHLARSIETWVSTPDFPKAEKKMDLIGRQYSYGMFIAEAVDAARYPQFCHPGSEGQWGEGTCVPSLSQPAYYTHVKWLVSEALKIGVVDFLFGQLTYQDGGGLAPRLFEELRAMAKSFDKPIVLGGQPNDNGAARPKDYWKAFDYLLSPIHVNRPGPYPAKEDLLPHRLVAIWQEPWVSLGNELVAEFDWSGINDDIHAFARRPLEDRKDLLKQIYRDLKGKNIGFPMPIRIPLNEGISDGCHGVNQWVFDARGCELEDAIQTVFTTEL